MRNKLSNIVGQTLKFSGIFNEITFIKNTGNYSILVKPVYHRGHIVCDHAWIAFSKASNPIKELELDKYDEITFTAEVEQYEKRKGSVEYGLKNISNVSIVIKGKGRNYIDEIKHFTFEVVEQQRIKIYGGKSVILTQNLSKPLAEGIYLRPGVKITCEYVKAREDKLELRLRTDNMKKGHWIRKIYFNPIKNNQTISVRGFFQILLPPQVYSDLKRAYFKIMLKEIRKNPVSFS